MKTITLQKAVELLEDCSAVVIENAVIYPSLADLTGEDENEFLYLSWTDDEGYEYCEKFVEQGNREVKIIGSSMFLEGLNDDEGEKTQLVLLRPWNLELEVD